MKGELCWISADIKRHIYDLTSQGLSVTEALRVKLGLPSQEPLNKKKDRPEKNGSRLKYLIDDLDVGNSKVFFDAQWQHVFRSLKRQQAALGKEFKMAWRDGGIQVTRIK